MWCTVARGATIGLQGSLPAVPLAAEVFDAEFRAEGAVRAGCRWAPLRTAAAGFVQQDPSRHLRGRDLSQPGAAPSARLLPRTEAENGT